MAGRTILEIAKEAAARDATAPQPATLFGNQDRIARVLRTAATDVLRDYLRRTRWVGLSDFHSSWVFAFQPGRYAYPLPPDYLRMIPGTEMRGGWSLGLIGPATPQAWANWLYGVGTNTASHGWRIKNNAIWIDPTPTTEELVVIEYISRYPVVSEIRTGDYNLATDPLQTNAPIVPRDGWLDLENVENLMPTGGEGVGRYGILPGWGEAVWGAEPEELLKRLLPTSSVDPLPEVRRPEFTEDTDKPVFEDDHLLSLGMTWHLQRALGKPYAERADEYETELAVKVAEDAGGARSFRFGCDEHSEQGVVPLGDGRWLVS